MEMDCGIMHVANLNTIDLSESSVHLPGGSTTLSLVESELVEDQLLLMEVVQLQLMLQVIQTAKYVVELLAIRLVVQMLSIC